MDLSPSTSTSEDDFQEEVKTQCNEVALIRDVQRLPVVNGDDNHLIVPACVKSSPRPDHDVYKVSLTNCNRVFIGNGMQFNVNVHTESEVEEVNALKETVCEIFRGTANPLESLQGPRVVNYLASDHRPVGKAWYIFFALSAFTIIAGLIYAGTLWFFKEELSSDEHLKATLNQSNPIYTPGAKEESTSWFYYILVTCVPSCLTFFGGAVFYVLIYGRSTRNDSGTEVIHPDFLPFAPKMKGRDFWLASPPTNPMDDNTLPVRRIIIIHTASEDHLSSPRNCDLIRQIQMIHMESKGWSDIGYNFLIGGDGVVYMGRGWDKVGAHTKGFNLGALGIAFVGTYTNKMPHESQLLALSKLLDLGVRIKKVSKKYKLCVHCQFQSTASPGKMLVRHLRSWPHFDSSLPIPSWDD